MSLFNQFRPIYEFLRFLRLIMLTFLRIGIRFVDPLNGNPILMLNSHITNLGMISTYIVDISLVDLHWNSHDLCFDKISQMFGFHHHNYDYMVTRQTKWNIHQTVVAGSVVAALFSLKQMMYTLKNKLLCISIKVVDVLAKYLMLGFCSS